MMKCNAFHCIFVKTLHVFGFEYPPPTFKHSIPTLKTFEFKKKIQPSVAVVILLEYQIAQSKRTLMIFSKKSPPEKFLKMIKIMHS